MCGLRSSPAAWQDYLAEVLQKLSFVRPQSEPNVHTNAPRDCYIMVYVDDVGTWRQDYCRLHLRGHPEAGATQGKPQQFLRRNIEQFSNSPALLDPYINNMSEETGVTTPGTTHYKPTIEDEARLDTNNTKGAGELVVNFNG